MLLEPQTRSSRRSCEERGEQKKKAPAEIKPPCGLKKKVGESLPLRNALPAIYAPGGDGDVFDLHNSYGICNILLMLDDESRDVREPRFGDGRWAGRVGVR